MHNTAQDFESGIISSPDYCCLNHPDLGRLSKVSHELHLAAETPTEPDPSFLEHPLNGASFRQIHSESSRLLLSAPKSFATISTGITLFYSESTPTFKVPSRPLRIAFLTSIRDVGADEKVGLRNGEIKYARYLKGTIEHILRSTTSGRLNGFCEVVGIISDDLPIDLQQSPFGELPSAGQWIFPKNLRASEHQNARDLCYNLPSDFRKLPMQDSLARQERKLDFETRVANLLLELNADVLVTDHYMAKLDYLVDPKSPLSTIVMNTHPGIIREDYAFACRGKDPYNDIIKLVQGLDNETSSASFNLSKSPKLYTGATFHFSDRGIDSGPILCEVACTPVFPDDSEDQLCRRNYHLSKNIACELGLLHFSSNIYEY